MKTKVGITAGGLVVVALPLFVAVGCAGNKQNLAQADAAQEEVQAADDAAKENAVQLAIAGMDGYMKRLDQQQANAAEESNASTAESETAQASAGQATEELPSEKTETPVAVSGPAKEDDAAQIPAEISDEQMSVGRVSESPASDVAAADETTPVMDEAVAVSPPAQSVFFFTSNSDVPAAGDDAALLQHAQYLKQHPNMILVISGHADSRGAKLYNQHLSEQRAQHVADILLAAGVSPAQLRVGGMGDSVPMINPKHWQENRRVEFVYQDSMVANNQ